MNKLFSLILLSAAIPLIGMDAEKSNQPDDATIVADVSQLIFELANADPNCKKIGELKSVGGIAALYAIHKSGKPFPQCAYVTPWGTILRSGLDADDFHTIISHVEFSHEIIPVVPSNSISVPVMHIRESCFTRAKRLAAEIPEDQTARLMCEPLRVVLLGIQMPVMETNELTRIMQWAQEHNLTDEFKEAGLVSLDAFAGTDGKAYRFIDEAELIDPKHEPDRK